MNYVNEVKKGIEGAGYISDEEIKLGFQFTKDEVAAVTFLEKSETKKSAKNSQKRRIRAVFKTNRILQRP